MVSTSSGNDNDNHVYGYTPANDSGMHGTVMKDVVQLLFGGVMSLFSEGIKRPYVIAHTGNVSHGFASQPLFTVNYVQVRCLS
jgi:hypothetical protein